MSVKKLFLNFVLALTIAFTSTVATTQKTEAAILIGLALDSRPPERPSYGVLFFSVALCLFFLPVCLLDEKSNGEASVSADHLAANGYSPEEIADIMANQKTMVENLSKGNMAFKILPQDSRESVSRDIKQINPNASESYIDFISESAGL